MALLHADNFSRYNDDEALMLNGVYVQVADCFLVTDPDGISGGHVLQLGGSAANDAVCRYVLPTVEDTVGVASRVWFPQLPVADDRNCCPILFRDITNNNIVVVQVLNTGRIRVRNDSVTFGDTVNPVITANGWYHIETKVFRDAAAGTVEVRVEGVPVLTLTGLALGALDIAQVTPYTGEAGGGFEQVYQFKDFVVWDGTGTYNNDFLGSVLVAGLSVTSDVSLNWTPSSGATGYEILDNVPPVDTTYISAGDPPPSPYVGTLSNLPADVTSVKGLITYVRAAKSDGGDGSLQVGLISDPSGTPTTVLGADRPITVAQTYWADVFETDPETSAPWLPSAVDLAQIQIDRTT